jgi:ATP-dependent DNA helicase RecG
LYGGLTVADIRKKMLSERRNELMAELFHRVHFIEKWGRGIKMILEREPHTEFEELGTHFIATFRRNSYELTNPIEFGEKYGETTQKSSQKTSVKTSVKIIEAIRQNSDITIPELAELTGVTARSVERNVQRLQLENRLRRVGPDKGGYWAIVKE